MLNKDTLENSKNWSLEPERLEPEKDLRIRMASKEEREVRTCQEELNIESSKIEDDRHLQYYGKSNKRKVP